MSDGTSSGSGPTGTTVRRPGLRSFTRRHVVLVDALWAAALLLLGSLLTLTLNLGSVPVPMLTRLLLGAVLTVPLVWRRRSPEPVAALVAALQFAQLVLGPRDVLPANVLVTVTVLYTVTAYGRDRAWPAYLGVAAAGCVLLAVVLDPNLAVVAGAAVLAAVLAGYLRRIVRVRDEATLERARRLQVERDSEVALAAERERRRIARDLHDVIAHSLTVIVAQADGGRYAARHDPQAAERTLQTVATTARAALADLRVALGALRTAGPAGTTPLPGAADVPALVASVRDSGHPVALTVTGDPGTVPAAAGLTVYRVVQESLTNVLKHAGPEVSATVETHHGPAVVRVAVADDGVGSASRLPRGGPDGDVGTGTGLAGMRERVEAMGGRFHAGPRDGGGWLVVADVPLSSGSRA